MYGFLTEGLDVFMLSMKEKCRISAIDGISMHFWVRWRHPPDFLRGDKSRTLEVILLLASSWTVTPMCKSHKFRPFGMGTKQPQVLRTYDHHGLLTTWTTWYDPPIALTPRIRKLQEIVFCFAWASWRSLATGWCRGFLMKPMLGYCWWNLPAPPGMYKTL